MSKKTAKTKTKTTVKDAFNALKSAEITDTVSFGETLMPHLSALLTNKFGSEAKLYHEDGSFFIARISKEGKTATQKIELTATNLGQMKITLVDQKISGKKDYFITTQECLLAFLNRLYGRLDSKISGSISAPSKFAPK